MINDHFTSVSPQHWCEGVEIPDGQDEQHQGGDDDARGRDVVHNPVQPSQKVYRLIY